MLQAWLISTLLGGLVGTAVYAWRRERRAKMLYDECVALNARWRLTCDVMILRAIRETIDRKKAWTTTEEELLRERAQQLEALGVSLQALGMSTAEVHECVGRVVH